MTNLILILPLMLFPFKQLECSDEELHLHNTIKISDENSKTGWHQKPTLSEKCFACCNNFTDMVAQFESLWDEQFGWIKLGQHWIELAKTYIQSNQYPRPNVMQRGKRENPRSKDKLNASSGQHRDRSKGLGLTYLFRTKEVKDSFVFTSSTVNWTQLQSRIRISYGTGACVSTR